MKALSNYCSLLFENCIDGVIILTQTHDIIYVNNQAEALFENEFSLLWSRNPSIQKQLFYGEKSSPVVAADLPFQQVISGAKVADLELFLPSSSPGKGHWLRFDGFPLSAQADLPQSGIVIMVKDITGRKIAAAAALTTVPRDSLTGLLQRSVFIDRVDHALARLNHDPSGLVAMVYIDINHLKWVNDAFGHDIGDRLLVEFAHRLITSLRSEDTVSRLGSDTFALLLEDVASYSAVVSTIEHLYGSLDQPFFIADQPIQVDVSMGIAFGDADSKHPEDLLRAASMAMYQAKQTSGQRYRVFEDAMQTHVEGNLRLEIALRRAIPNQELVLYYQPIVSIRSKETIGFEALVRWQHPEQGLLDPVSFIQIAERTGLIIPLGWWVLREACRQLRSWQDTEVEAKDLFVSVNMSSAQFSQGDVVGKITSILAETQLQGKNLKLEITESVLIENSASIVEQLTRIRALGIKLSIDDFGTGYSSLSYLYRFPFDTLKIDRSFIEDADTSYDKLEILQSMVRLAWNLGLELVAEGIETEKHYSQLKALRCESGQGYLFSKPLTAMAMEALIHKQFEA
ncbi:MAG: bifunctional diguanylate cyclase/phosphodiesterase [Cyanobacteria bacterium]|nr:bifunctional diguanylate cyclase/phosphodiesterase [Cyanobacteriota bacterium]